MWIEYFFYYNECYRGLINTDHISYISLEKDSYEPGCWSIEITFNSGQKKLLAKSDHDGKLEKFYNHFKDAMLGIPYESDGEIEYTIPLGTKPKQQNQEEAQKIKNSNDKNIIENWSTVRATNAAKSLGIETFDELSKCTLRQLERTPNLGKVTLRELIESLAQRGLTLRAAKECEHEEGDIDNPKYCKYCGIRMKVQ